MTDLPDVGRFGAAFEDFVRAMTMAAQRGESDVARRLREHLGADPTELPTTAVDFPQTEQANLQLAIEDVLADAEILGYTQRRPAFGSVGLAEIVAGSGMTGPISFGPVGYADVEVGDGRVIQCITSAVFLAHHDGAPVALVLTKGGDNPMQPSSLRLEGVSPETGAVSALVGLLRSAMRTHNVFRGRIISLHQRGHGEQISVQFHAVPSRTETAPAPRICGACATSCSRNARRSPAASSVNRHKARPPTTARFPRWPTRCRRPGSSLPRRGRRARAGCERRRRQPAPAQQAAAAQPGR